MFTPQQLQVSTLGTPRHRSPLGLSTVKGDGVGNFVLDDERVLHEIRFRAFETPRTELAFELAGARESIFFDPAETTAAIVTCGGLCPGLNNVIRSIFFELHANYGVPRVLGIRYGYQGLDPRKGEPPIELTGDFVEEIHKVGGTVLGSSRGSHPVEVMVEFLAGERVNLLFCVGGDGTQRGAHAIAEEARRRELPLAVIGIPKTIDNDIAFVDRSFGFETAIAKGLEHITCAHNEARGAPYGIGLVKLMGRHAGFIAAAATLASGQVNFTLIPEVPSELDGENGFLAKLERRMHKRRHAVIVVAEGAGQDLLPEDEVEYDASGNRKLGDVGTFLKRKIGEHFAGAPIRPTVKYFDPSYHIRSVPANCSDSLLSTNLARNAVHAAMEGKTDTLIGMKHDQFIHVPLPLVCEREKRVDPESDLWIGVMAATGQKRW